VSEDLRDRAFRGAKDLFAMDLEAKNSQLLRITPETNCGFLPYEGETLNSSRRADKKEAYNVKRSNLTEGCPPVFVDASAELWQACEDFGARFSMACSLALGLPSDYFSKTMKSMDLCTLR
jgi:isopenicillin N synthase-like dioxygenase